jgi:hypothetical protein
MPTETEFEQVGQRTLQVAIARFGYLEVAARLGLKRPMHAGLTPLDPALSGSAESDTAENECRVADCDTLELRCDDFDEATYASSVSLEGINLDDIATHLGIQSTI